MKPPVIICPFSRTGDEIAGETPDQVAVNLAAATRVSLSFRCKPVRQIPASVWEAFFRCPLSQEARAALKYVEGIYTRLRPKPAQLEFGSETGEPAVNSHAEITQ